MCGIVGMLTYGGPIETWRGDIARVSARMARRGPDASGLWSDDVCCMLGFRRLSILDLSATGDQPMLTPDGRYALIFNGELYNFREIRTTLEKRGVAFRSTGDAEVALAAIASDGVKALASFNGMFALAFYDRVARRLLLARDHAGIKPLYVLQHREGVLFASQFDQLLSHPWARDRSIHAGALALYLNVGYIPPPFALLEGSSELDAGAWMTIDASGDIEHGRHFSFPMYAEPDLRGVEAMEAVDAAVASAVRRQLVSDVPIGVFLSGGIDSPLVAAKIRASSHAALPAFTVGTQGDRLDETPDAARYASALGLEHVVEHIAPAGVLSLLDEAVAAYSEPHDDYSIFPTLAVSRLARERVKVALSGDGGDDVFWGYPARMVHPLRVAPPPSSRSWMTAAKRAVSRAMGAGVTSPAHSAGAGRTAGEAQLRRSRFVDADHLSAVFPSMPALPRQFELFEFDTSSVDRLAQWLRWNEYTGHLGRVLRKVDRASMHHSLEVRVPLLDREVIDIAVRCDWRSCVDLKSGLGKLPLRAALQRHAGFQTVRKRGFDIPMAEWLRGPLRPLVEDMLLSRTDVLGLPLDRRALGEIFRRHRLHLENAPWLIWRLLSLVLWEARHLRSVPAHV